jgi:membrane protein DedA with SNARE-associated domain
MMIGGALAGWLIIGFGVGLLGKTMIAAAIIGAPLGAICGFILGLRWEQAAERLKPRPAEARRSAGLWDREIDG